MVRVCRQTAELFRTQRKLWLPFVLAVFIEACVIGLIWLAPHPPFSVLLAPPIRYVFGEKTLHYPWHLGLLYHVMPHARVAAQVLLGAFMAGIACVMVRQTYEGRPLSLREALISRRVRYGRVTLLWLLSWGSVEAASSALARAPLPMPPAAWLTIGVTVLLRWLLVYAVPAAVFEGAIWRQALLRGVREAARHPLTTLLVVFLPSAMLAAYAAAAPPARIAELMMRFTPEIVLAFVIGRLLLWMVTDALLTVGAAHLWWIHRTAGAGGERRGARDASSARPPTPRYASAVAVAMAVTVAATGCSATYNGERLFWKAQRLHHTLPQASARATPEQLATIIAAYERVIRKAAGTIWAARAQLAIAGVYAHQQDYTNAAAAYQLMLQSHTVHQEVRLDALSGLAAIYETEQNWEGAVNTYREIAERHRWSQAGLRAPLQIAQLSERLRKPEPAVAAYRRAVVAYLEAIKDAPTPELEIRAKWFLAQAYYHLGEWQRAVGVLHELSEIPSGVNRPLVLMALAQIYETNLSDPQQADALYRTVMEDFPGHPLRAQAKALHERLVQPSAAGPESLGHDGRVGMPVGGGAQ